MSKQRTLPLYVLKADSLPRLSTLEGGLHSGAQLHLQEHTLLHPAQGDRAASLGTGPGAGRRDARRPGGRKMLEAYPSTACKGPGAGSEKGQRWNGACKRHWVCFNSA